MGFHDIKGWHSRGYLPHFDVAEAPVTITYRLEGSLPASLIREWREELAATARGGATARTLENELRRRVEAYLDEGHGPAYLCDPVVGAIVEESFLLNDGIRYELHAWVIMPNHVHVLMTPKPDFSLTTIVHTWKSFTANRIRRSMGIQGQVWQRDYFDRFIRDGRHFEIARQYIENNPVKAGLCVSADTWPFSSARSLRLANVR